VTAGTKICRFPYNKKVGMPDADLFSIHYAKSGAGLDLG
jgi:hypothetical protein